jgi:hypothetical protein
MAVHDPERLTMVEDDDRSRLRSRVVEALLVSLRENRYRSLDIIFGGSPEDAKDYAWAVGQRVRHAAGTGEEFELSCAFGPRFSVLSVTRRLAPSGSVDQAQPT